MTKTRVGWIGAGVIGGSCAARLLDAQYPLVVSTRTRAKAEPLLQKGAQWAERLGFPEGHEFAIAIVVGHPAITKQAHPIGEGKVSYVE